MKYAIFSDMHANLEAYEAVLDALAGEGISRFFCVGDIVGYGADPAPCIALTRKLDPVIVCGNHDWAAAGLFSTEYFNASAKEAVLWTASMLSGADKDYLGSLKLTHADEELTLVHGTLMHPAEFDYVFDLYTAYKMFESMTTKAAFIGHSHAPGIFYTSAGSVEYTRMPEVEISADKRYLVNVGSVGQPRDGDWRASFCVWDKDRGVIEIRRIEYDVGKAKRKILDAGLPASLAERLSEGR